MMQNNYKTRWSVIEYYYGTFNDKRVIAATESIEDACRICDGYLYLNHGRPFTYKIEKIADTYVDYLDNPIRRNILLDETIDFTRYLNGVDAL